MKNVLAFVTSLVIAIILWLNVQPLYDPDKEREIPVKLELRDMPDGLIAVTFPDTITVVASGMASELGGVTAKDFVAFVDMKNAKPGFLEFPISVSSPARASYQVHATRNRVKIEIQRLASDQRSVELEPTGLPPANYIYDGASIVPSSVQISGPEENLALVKRVRVLFDLSKIGPKSDFTLSVETLDEKGLPVPMVKSDPATVTISPAVASAPTSKRVLITPVFKGQPQFGYKVVSYELKPNQLELSGGSAELGAVSSLETVPIDLSDLTADTIQTIEVPLPAGLKSKTGTKIRVVVKVAQLPVSPVNPVTPPNQ